MKNLWNDFYSYCVAGVMRNAQVLTVMTVLAIIFSGITYMMAPQSWYIPLALYGVVAGFIIFGNGAASILKGAVATIITIVLSSVSYLLGVVINPYDATPLMWFFSYWILLFSMMAFSYIVVKANSRWNAIIGSLFVAGLSSYVASIAFLSSVMGALFVFIFGGVFFVYGYSISKMHRKQDMPINILPDTLVENLAEEVSNKKGWNIRVTRQKDDKGYIYLFTKNKGYMIYPIWLDESLTATFNRRGKHLGLGYKGKSINDWMLETSIHNNPTWKAHGVQLFPVFLNLYDGTVKESKVINTTMQDVYHVYPVGLLDGADLVSENKKTNLVHRLEKDFSSRTHTISPKQYTALLGLGASLGVATEE